MQEESTRKAARYKKTSTVLGEGSYKTVTKAIDEEEGKEVAYNEFRIKHYENETQSVSSFSKEITLLKAIDHPNILKILDYWFTDDNFTFITELMTGGSLKEYIEKNGPLSTKLIRKWGRQILEGLQYLHTMDAPIIHRDVKNDNIFVNTAVGEVKIGDLGLAKERKNKRYTIVGTPHFMAREMFEGEGYTEKIDIYAFGMCLIEMATGKAPYIEHRETKDIYKSVLQGILPKALQMVSDPCLKSLIMSCIVPSSVRYTTLQCLDHHFFHPEVECTGDCMPKESVAVYPLQFNPVKNMELSIISVVGNQVTFQILLQEIMKFVKFEYDMEADTVEKICEELLAEKIVEEDSIDTFSALLNSGLKTVESKIKAGQIRDGVIGLDPAEMEEIKDKDMVISNNIERKTEESESSFQSISFGVHTLEEMRLIEESMKIAEAKKEIEKKREDEVTQRLKSKLQQKTMAKQQGEPQSDTDYVCSLELSKSVKFKNEPAPQSELISENIYSQFPNAVVPGEDLNERIHGMSVSVQYKNKNESDNDAVSSASTRECSDSIHENKSRIEGYNRSDFNDVRISNRLDSNDSKCFDNRREITDDRSDLACKVRVDASKYEYIKKETSDDALFKNKNDSTTSLPEKESTESLNSNNIRSTVVSPPCRFTEEQFSGEDNLSELCETYKHKYKNNCTISEFIIDVSALSKRTEEVAKRWLKALRDEDIETVFDLKLMVHEDWEKLPLTVFCCRMMQNMLYGLDGVPPKEKLLPLNPKLKEYDNRMSVKEFLDDVCETIHRKELISAWEDKLLAQDIQTVGELKSLHPDDWDRLGITAFAYRILKNVIFRKGRIIID